MKIAISASLFAAYFVYVYAAPVAVPSEQLVNRNALEKPPVFSPSKWSHVDEREIPPAFRTYVWSTDKATETKGAEVRDVEARDTTLEPPPPFGTSQYGEWGWLRRRPDGTLVGGDEKRAVGPPPFNGEIGWRLRGDAQSKREVPPPFSGHNWVRSERDVDAAPIWIPDEWFPGPGQKREIPPLFDDKTWISEAETVEKRAAPPPFNGEIGWRLRNPDTSSQVEKREVPPPFDFREWEWAGKRVEEAEARAIEARAAPPPPFDGRVGWRVKGGEETKREVPPPFDFREWNWAGKRLAEAEAKAAAAKRMIPPPTGSEFNLFTGGNGWPTPREVAESK